MEALGANVMLDGAQVAGAIKECGFGFLFAQMFHPAMKNVSPVRKEMGVKTIVGLPAGSHSHQHQIIFAMCVVGGSDAKNEMYCCMCFPSHCSG